MSEYTFKEIDQEGLETLKAISEAKNFNKWMFDTIYPHCEGKILEIGSGIGNISEYFIENKDQIYLSDLRENYLEFLEKNFRKTAAGIINLDIVEDNFEKSNVELLGTFDTVFALNVIEHIHDDGLALKNIYKLLKPGGKVIILVPAYQSLFNTFDKALEHYRRYTTKSISKVIEIGGFELVHKTYFNAVGIAGWILSGSILKKETIPAGQMKLYNALVPIFKVVDLAIFKSFGLSAISVGRKN